MQKRKLLTLPMIINILGVVVGEGCLVYTDLVKKNIINTEVFKMETGSVIAIVVALIGVAGGIWMQVVQFKKDSGKIDSVNVDTSEIKPDVKNINENVKKVRDEVVEKIVPSLGQLDGIATLVDAYKIEQVLKERQSPQFHDKDVLKGVIDLVYEENSSLIDQYKRALQRINQLEIELSAKERELCNYQLKEKTSSNKER